MVGALVNATAIFLGGAAGLWTRFELLHLRQRQIQTLLGVLTVVCGLSTVWLNVHGPVKEFIAESLIVLLALTMGKFTGRSLRLQAWVNRAGQYAAQRLTEPQPTQAKVVGDVFVSCTAVYCLAPLAVLGSVMDGLIGDYKALIIKAIMDGLAAMAFARTVGWGVLAGALPVLVWQGTVTLAVRAARPPLEQGLLVESICATTGLLIFAVALVILKLRRIELVNYLPSLVYAPVLAWAFRHIGIL